MYGKKFLSYRAPRCVVFFLACGLVSIVRGDETAPLNRLISEAAQHGEALDYRTVKESLDLYRKGLSSFSADEILLLVNSAKSEPTLLSLVLFWLNANEAYEGCTIAAREQVFSGLVTLLDDPALTSQSRQTCVEFLRRAISADMLPVEKWRVGAKQDLSVGQGRRPSAVDAANLRAKQKAGRLLQALEKHARLQQKQDGIAPKCILAESSRLFHYELVGRQDYQRVLREVAADKTAQERTRTHAARMLIDVGGEDPEVISFLTEQAERSAVDAASFSRTVDSLLKKRKK